MDDAELLMRFPHLRRIETPPWLGLVAGFGTALLGACDYDEDTNTYVKVRYLCVLGIPVLALGAYRVVDRPQGYLFLGRQPLPDRARLWNGLALCLVLGLASYGAWYAHTSSPGYLAGRVLAEADQLAAAGDIAQAASLYRDVAVGNTEHAPRARERLQELLAEPLRQAKPEAAAAALRIGVEVGQRPGGMPDTGLFDRGLGLVTAHAEANPRGALQVLSAVAPLAPDAGRVAALRRQLLERAVAQDANDLDTVSELAVLYEAADELPKCEALLRPHASRLGEREGARILGHLLTAQGKFEEAYAVLQPYTDTHLAKLHAAEQAFKEVLTSAQRALLEEIKSRRALTFPYERYQRAGEGERLQILEAYANPRLEADPAVKAAHEAMVRQSAVVPVALDLGMVRLQRARALADPAARRAELEAAEKTFLAVRGLAGESDAFRVNLAQVYYWLGKHQEGRRLFDEVLAARQHQTETVLPIARLLREVGEHSAARALVEEAYQKERSPRLKYAIAAERAVNPRDLDDQVSWLSRADPADVEVQALLSTSRGRKAIREGKDEEAITFLRAAVAAYDRQPENAASVNNSAGAWRTLYGLTGDRRDFDQVLTRYEKALALDPRNALTLTNAANTQLESGLGDVLDGAIELGTLRLTGSVSLLSHVCQDDAGRRRYAERVRANPKISKARAGYERTLVLAPKDARAYAALASLAEFLGDREALRSLLGAAQGLELDLADETRHALDYFTGTKDPELRQTLASTSKRYAALVQTTRPKGGPTFAVAAVVLAGTGMQGEALGVPANPDALVQLTEEAHTAARSQATYWALVEVLSFRIARALAGQDAAFATIATRSRRSSSFRMLLAATLTGNPDRGHVVRANRDFQRLVQLVLEYDARFPERPSPWIWVVLQAAGRDEATAVGRRVLEDQTSQISRALTLRVAPLDVANVLEDYWHKQLAGKEAEGRTLLQRLRELGVPLPLDRN
ncbi:MAG: hypothetical protein L0Z62_30565 [Gemmataceae bacterium]|nr:hypothetical protein [Gemmataceae bacterium]